jgi:hypothetical protein
MSLLNLMTSISALVKSAHLVQCSLSFPLKMERGILERCDGDSAVPRRIEGLTMAEAKLKMWVPWSVLTNTPRGTVEEFRTLLKKYSTSSLLKAARG